MMNAEFKNHGARTRRSGEERAVRLQTECAKLNPAEEVALAEEAWAEEASEWPEY
jgi:hypothetical protein